MAIGFVNMVNASNPNNLYVQNNDIETINIGDAVSFNPYATGEDGVILSNASSEDTSEVIGIAVSQMTVGAKGYIVTFGSVRGIDTSAFVAGSKLYLGANNGEVVSTPPQLPNFQRFIGYCVVSAVSGEIFIALTKLSLIKELSDVNTTGIMNGSILRWDLSTLEWVPAVGWDDIMVPVTATKALGSKDPDFATFKNNGAGSQGVFTYWFDSSLEEELYFSVQFPHTWKGTEVHPHVHWTPKITSDGNPAAQKVKWGLEYTWTNIGDTFSNTTIIYGNQHIPADEDVIAGWHYLTPITAIVPTMSQNGLSSMMLCRLFRDATDAVNDTYESDAGLLQFDFHYEVNSLGSEGELSHNP